MYRLEGAATRFHFCENRSQAHLLTIVNNCKDECYSKLLTGIVCCVLARGYGSLHSSVFGKEDAPQPDLLMSLTDLLAWEGDLIVIIPNALTPYLQVQWL